MVLEPRYRLTAVCSFNPTQLTHTTELIYITQLIYIEALKPIKTVPEAFNVERMGYACYVYKISENTQLQARLNADYGLQASFRKPEANQIKPPLPGGLTKGSGEFVLLISYNLIFGCAASV